MTVKRRGADKASRRYFAQFGNRPIDVFLAIAEIASYVYMGNQADDALLMSERAVDFHFVEAFDQVADLDVVVALDRQTAIVA